MANVSSIIQQEPYKITITSPVGNTLIADEPEAQGGKDLGFSPKELLAASLAACTSATLKMYANRKQWDLQEVKIDVDLEFDAAQNRTVINRKLTFTGNLDESQKSRLMAVADACPVHKILSNPVDIHSEVT